MTTNDYVIISETSGSSYKFGAIQLQIVDSMQKSVQRKVTGLPDISYGRPLVIYKLTFRLKGTEDRAGYGDFDDFRAIASRYNPQVTPGVRFEFTDHYGETFESALILTESMPIEPVTTILDSVYSLYIVRLDIVAWHEYSLDFSTPISSMYIPLIT